MKYFLIVIIVVVLLGGGYFLMKGSHAQPQGMQATPTTATTQNTQGSQPTGVSVTTQPSSAKMSENAVSYTSNGFEPHSITIKAGQTVRWTNKSSDDMWVASNPHPTHTDYPGFDALKNIPSGGTYSFTFTKVGNWGYHNHLNPSQMGVVVITQ